MKKFLLIAALYVIPAFAFGALGGVIGHSRAKTVNKIEAPVGKCTCPNCPCDYPDQKCICSKCCCEARACKCGKGK